MKKWVLVRSRMGTLYVLRPEELRLYNADTNAVIKPDVVAESDDRDELIRFKKLTEEGEL